MKLGLYDEPSTNNHLSLHEELFYINTKNPATIAATPPNAFLSAAPPDDVAAAVPVLVPELEDSAVVLPEDVEEDIVPVITTTPDVVEADEDEDEADEEEDAVASAASPVIAPATADGPV